MRTIAVGSLNPVKVKAVTLAVQQYWENVNIVSFKVVSNVSNMPITKSETRIGAKNRAYNVLREANCWIGIGSEGGVTQIDEDWYLFSCTLATDGKTEAWGGETLIKLTPEITENLGDYTIELGDIMDLITGINNVKQKDGAVGYLTNNAISRTNIFYYSTLMALAPWTYI